MDETPSIEPTPAPAPGKPRRRKTRPAKVIYVPKHRAADQPRALAPEDDQRR